MSVIQDALRRKLEEQRAAKDSRPSRGRPEPQPPQAPPVAQQVLENETLLNPPRAMPMPQQVPVTRRPGRSDPQRTIRLLLVTIIVMFTVGLVGAVIYFIDARKSELLRSASSVPGLGGGSSGASAGESIPMQVTATPESSGANSGTTEASGTVSTSNDKSAANDSGKWPLVEVGGVLTGGSSKNNSAILNGDMIRMNRKIEGVRLVDVGEDGVTLEYGGDQRFVEIGTSTKD